MPTDKVDANLTQEDMIVKLKNENSKLAEENIKLRETLEMLNIRYQNLLELSNTIIESYLNKGTIKK